MADQKVTALDALGSLTTDDLFYVVDDPAGTPASKKLAVSVIDARYLLEANDLSDLDNAATARGNLGVAIGSDVQAYDAGLADVAGLAVTDGNFIVGDGANWVAENGATARTSLGVAIGSDVQAYDAELAALAGLTSAADKLPYFTGSETAAVADLTAFARSILDDADEATFKATVNLEIGTDVLAQQAIGIADDNLLEVDGSPNDDEYARFTANGLEGRTEAEFKGDFSLAIGTDVQAYDADLSAIAGLSSADSNFIVGSAGGWIAENGATARTSLGVAIGSDVQAYDAQLADLAGLAVTKGNVIVADGANWIALGVGSNTQVLTADSGEASGVKWAAGGGGAPTDAQYVVIALDGDLSDERVLTGTANQISIADGGANGNVVISTPQDIHTGASPTFVDTTLTGALNIPTTSATVGQIIQNSNRVFHTYGTSNLFIGSNSGNFTLTVANAKFNVGIAEDTLPALTTGIYNLAIGHKAGEALTEGTSNVLIGRRAGLALISGSNNVCLGNAAGWKMTTAGSNFCMGVSAGRELVDGGNNVAIGGLALGSAVSISQCVAIGANALGNTTGGANVAIGASAGLEIAGTEQNVAVGVNALRYATGASDCVAIGYIAGSYTETAGGTYIGAYAGQNVAAGEHNICIGWKAGDVITTGDDNIIIGYDIDPSGAAVSDELHIGDLLKGYFSAHGSGPAIHFMGGTPQSQQAHIVDADGTLADITTKFNTLLADLEGYGLLAVV